MWGFVTCGCWGMWVLSSADIGVWMFIYSLYIYIFFGMFFFGGGAVTRRY